ncbi:gamma-glutamyl-gamma-aminobutyrate hydrolase family protein [Streptomyces varsoviensis]|uniref:gamma-glutamyl-gamma-aminobutyrate hydrolase family protein n=1 Tax=Streptomyces varsoviensis TaxID=67373 RepID=UPI000662137E|nr:type 1 glutamine amidotransferase [Streptomyces varsoviensis]
MTAARRDRPRRPLIALPQRFSATASALRYGAVVTARALSEAVLRAGGEPFMMHPGPPEEAAERLARCDGVLLPGGGDVAPRLYAADAAVHDRVYDVDAEQDAFDLAVARHALAAGLPLLAVCRGLQVVNVALGGTLRQDMGGDRADHRHRVHRVTLTAGSAVATAMGPAGPAAGPAGGGREVEVSCYHHQCADRLGAGLAVTGRAEDGTIEALELPRHHAWFAAVQWHPEDTADSNPAQQGLFNALVTASRARLPSPANNGRLP